MSDYFRVTTRTMRGRTRTDQPISDLDGLQEDVPRFPAYETRKRRAQTSSLQDMPDIGFKSLKIEPSTSSEPFSNRTRKATQLIEFQDSPSKRTRSHHVEPSTSGQSLAPFSDDMSFSLPEYSDCVDYWSVASNIVSGSDLFLSSKAGETESGGHRNSNLDTPPGSPKIMSGPVVSRRPASPSSTGSRPATPTYCLTSSLDSDMRPPSPGSSSLVDSSILVSYGPPPTPMCSTTVGNLSSSSSSLIELPLSSTTTTSAAPPSNILNSDDDNTEIDNDNFGNITSPDINDLPSSPPPLSIMSKHSHRLRIRAPLPRSSRSSRANSGSRARSGADKACNKIRGEVKVVLNEKEKKVRLVISKSSKDVSPSSSSHRAKGGGGASLPESSSSTFKSAASLPSSPQLKSSLKSARHVERRREQTEMATSPIQVNSNIMPSPDICRDRHDSYVRDGNLLSIRLINFMTHKHFYQKWNPNVNIITGANGSGKSAIQMGLLMVYGDKAANTQRTTSVRNLIKKGCTYADVEVCMKNYNGTMSIETYGNVITLMRRIKFNGGGFYQITGPDGQKRKIKQNELTYICHKLQIDPNNPAQFLQQQERSGESGKVGSKGKDRFEKFKDSTQLTQKENMLKQAYQNVADVETSIREKEEMMNHFEGEVERLKKACDLIETLEHSTRKIQELENEHRWSEWKVKDDEATQLQTKTEQTFKDIQERKKGKTQLEEELAHILKSREEHAKILATKSSDLASLLKEKEGNTNELREAKRTQLRVDREKRGFQEEIRKFQAEAEGIKSRMNEETNTCEEEQKQYTKDIEHYKKLIQVHEQELQDLRPKRDAILGERNEYKARERQCKETVKNLQSQLNQAKKELNKSAKFGEEMKELLNRINRRRDWTRKPIGPLGAYVTVPDATYAPLIERILYKSLYTFVVQSNDDQWKLRQLIDEVYEGDSRKSRNSKERYVKQPDIVFLPILNLKEYMMKVGETARRLASHRTVLSQLAIEDDLVTRAIIETSHCDRTLLFDNYKAAGNVMKNKCPSDVRDAYTLDWYKVFPPPRYQFHPVQVSAEKARSTNIIPMTKLDAEVHIKRQIEEEEELLANCRAQLMGGRDGTGLERQLQMKDDCIQRLNKDISQYTRQIHQAEKWLLESCSKSKDKDSVSEMKDVNKQIAQRQNELQSRTVELERLGIEMARIEDEAARLDSEIQRASDEVSELEAPKTFSYSKVEKLRKNIESCRAGLERMEADYEHLNRLSRKVMEERKEKGKQAAVMGSKPEILDRDPDSVKREIDSLKVAMQKHSSLLKQKKQIVTEYNSSKTMVEQISKENSYIRELCECLKPYLKVGSDCYNRVKNVTTMQLQTTFRTLVEAHGLTGDLDINWNKEILSFYVSPDKQAESRALQNYSKEDGKLSLKDKAGLESYWCGLSGGERSKALIFFIMAMWKVADLPFHVVDEFEVCQDDQSRALITATLIQHARNHPDAQFFILTPLSLDKIPTDDPFITIKYLVKQG